MELTHASTSRVSVSELLQELQVTQKELDNLRVCSFIIYKSNLNEFHGVNTFS